MPQRGSYGLEGSNGYVLTGSTSGRSFGHALSTGDTVGLGVNFKKMEVSDKGDTGILAFLDWGQRRTSRFNAKSSGIVT